jgi:hypothetical protein
MMDTVVKIFDEFDRVTGARERALSVRLDRRPA